MTEANKATTNNHRASGPIDPALPEKKRGRRRLIGAAAFLAGAAVLFSVVFDHEPKPANPELSIKIPPKDKSAVGESVPAPKTESAVVSQPSTPPAVAPATPTVEAPKVEAPKVEAPRAEPPKVEAPKVEPPKLEAPKLETPKVEAQKAEPKAGAKASQRSDPLEALTKEASAASFMVQIGAFSSETKLETALSNAKKLGYKPQSELVKTKSGERTRVRVGPFNSREAANKARDKFKAMGYEPVLIALP